MGDKKDKFATPGAHDCYNVASVKLAEATRVRLYLPGLGTGLPDEDETPQASSRASSATSDTARKARKKMQKMQNFARSEPPPAAGGGFGAADAILVMEELLDLEEEPGSDGLYDDEGLDSPGAGATAGPRSGPASNKDRERAGSHASSLASSSHGGGDSSVRSGGAGSNARLAAFNRAGRGGAGGGQGPWPGGSRGGGSGAGTDGRGGGSAGGGASPMRQAHRAAPPSQPRVPIWERPLAPPESVRQKIVAAAVPEPRVLKAVAPKMLSLGIDALPPPTTVVAPSSVGSGVDPLGRSGRSTVQALQQQAAMAAALLNANMGMPQQPQLTPQPQPPLYKDAGVEAVGKLRRAASTRAGPGERKPAPPAIGIPRTASPARISRMAPGADTGPSPDAEGSGAGGLVSPDAVRRHHHLYATPLSSSSSPALLSLPNKAPFSRQQQQ